MREEEDTNSDSEHRLLREDRETLPTPSTSYIIDPLQNKAKLNNEKARALYEEQQRAWFKRELRKRDVVYYGDLCVDDDVQFCGSFSRTRSSSSSSSSSSRTSTASATCSRSKKAKRGRRKGSRLQRQDSLELVSLPSTDNSIGPDLSPISSSMLEIILDVDDLASKCSTESLDCIGQRSKVIETTILPNSSDSCEDYILASDGEDEEGITYSCVKQLAIFHCTEQTELNDLNSPVDVPASSIADTNPLISSQVSFNAIEEDVTNEEEVMISAPAFPSNVSHHLQEQISHECEAHGSSLACNGKNESEMPLPVVSFEDGKDAKVVNERSEEQPSETQAIYDENNVLLCGYIDPKEIPIESYRNVEENEWFPVTVQIRDFFARNNHNEQEIRKIFPGFDCSI